MKLLIELWSKSSHICPTITGFIIEHCAPHTPGVHSQALVGRHVGCSRILHRCCTFRSLSVPYGLKEVRN